MSARPRTGVLPQRHVPRQRDACSTTARIRLLDFEFSCRNHIAFDFANLFAETVMEHGLVEPPHFRIAEPRFTDNDIAALVGCYLDNADFDAPSTRDRPNSAVLVGETRRALLLSDYMYAMAALPLSLEPIQTHPFHPVRPAAVPQVPPRLGNGVRAGAFEQDALTAPT